MIDLASDEPIELNEVLASRTEIYSCKVCGGKEKGGRKEEKKLMMGRKKE